jgi:hypothetical protein
MFTGISSSSLLYDVLGALTEVPHLALHLIFADLLLAVRTALLPGPKQPTDTSYASSSTVASYYAQFHTKSDYISLVLAPSDTLGRV